MQRRRLDTLRISCDVLTPVAGDQPIHADAILTSAHRGACSGKIWTRSTPIAELPRLSSFRHPSLWVYWRIGHGHEVPLASAMQGAWRAEVDHVVRRRDAIDIESMSKTVTRGTGPDRDLMIPVPLRVVESRVWWDVVGNRRAVKKLLRNVSSIGGMRKQGYGKVINWSVDRVDDCSPLVRAGVSQRNLPQSWCSSYDRQDVGPVEPPYWHPGRNVARVPCGTECELAEEYQDVSDVIHEAFAPRS